MGESTIDPKVLEDAVYKALPTLFPGLLGTTSNPTVEFYNKFHHIVDEHDRDFIRKCDEDLSSTLVFAGLFSAVTSAFIVDIQSDLQPDFQEMSYTLLKIVASSALGNTPTGTDAVLPEWSGPDSTIVRVEAVLYWSLSATLLAALIAILGKQWLNRYASVEGGSVIDRGRHRRRKMDGMVTWKFDLVMECLPLMLQVALLLFGYALSGYLSFINKVVAGVVISFTTFGLLFYFLIVSAATLSYNCPFQTPISLIIHSLIRFDDEHKKYLRRSRKWFGHILSQSRTRWSRLGFGSPHGLGRYGKLDVNSSSDHVELPVPDPSDPPPSLFNKEANWDGYVLDSKCITRMFEMSTETATTAVIARFIPEIVWHAGIRDIPLERLYDTVLECFDRSSGHLILIPASRDKAYLNARALLHMGIQHKCIGDGSENTVFESISVRHQIMASKHYEGDSDLGSTLGIIDCVFGNPEPMRWANVSFTISHHAWMSHILLYRAWDALGKGDPLPNDIREFVLHSLRLDPAPPAQIVADCLFIAGLVIGIKLCINDLLVTDKSARVDLQINDIYEKLTGTFEDPASTTCEVNRALEVMELIAPLSENSIVQHSHRLFHVVIQAPISLACSQEKKWNACRLAMRGAYKCGKLLPWVEDPHNILTFLDYHFYLATKYNENQDEPIQNALCVLGYMSKPFVIQALERFTLANPSFVHGICYAFQDVRPFQVRVAALKFLALVSDGWFNAPRPIMGPGRMRNLCVDWASLVDNMKPTDVDEVRKATLTIFFGIIGSPHWCIHMDLEKWKLLEDFTSVPDDSRPFRRCIDNPELMRGIKDTEDPALMTLWLKILWLKYTELIPQVREQLETTSREVAHDKRKADLDVCLSAINVELRKVRSRTASPDIIRAKLRNLTQAKDSLTALIEC